MENKDNSTFNYTYSAKEQAEIKAIRKKYLSDETEDKMSVIRRLDASVTQKATVLSLVIGIIGSLILGIGMSLAMTDMGKVMNLTYTVSMTIGVITGVAGIILTCMAYPVYNRTVKKEREKIAPEIIRLTDELLK